MYTSEDIIEKTKLFVQKELENAEGGHDWFHILRVYNNALLISKNEAVDPFVVALAALLHDIADSKFYDGDESIGPQVARNFLGQHKVDSKVITHVVNIIKHVSFKGGNDTKSDFSSLELDVVQDADRLDAIGAVGIARTFNYGGFKNRKLYDPSIPVHLQMIKAEYKASTAPTINHFYEKLLLLKDKMNTKTAQKIALARHAFMEEFLDQFYAEWRGEK